MKTVTGVVELFAAFLSHNRRYYLHNPRIPPLHFSHNSWPPVFAGVVDKRNRESSALGTGTEGLGMRQKTTCGERESERHRDVCKQSLEEVEGAIRQSRG